MNHKRFCGPPEARFWAKVDKNGPTKVGMDTPCWEWRGARNRKGYGTFCPTDHGGTLAHRYAWILTNGPMPPGREACHRCHNRGCVRPDHLYAGTHQENVAEAVQLGHFVGRRVAQGEEHYLSKLSDVDVEQIRLLAGLHAAPHSVLAVIFGTTEKQVGNLVQLRKRADLGRPLIIDVGRRHG